MFFMSLSQLDGGSAPLTVANIETAWPEYLQDRTATAASHKPPQDYKATTTTSTDASVASLARNQQAIQDQLNAFKRNANFSGSGSQGGGGGGGGARTFQRQAGGNQGGQGGNQRGYQGGQQGGGGGGRGRQGGRGFGANPPKKRRTDGNQTDGTKYCWKYNQSSKCYTIGGFTVVF